MQEFADIPIALALVTGSTGQRQVAHPVRTVPGSRLHMIELQRDIAGITVGALMVPLEQDVLSELIARKRSVLIIHAFDIRVLQGLGIETRQFMADGADGAEPHQAAHPREHVAHTVL